MTITTVRLEGDRKLVRKMARMSQEVGGPIVVKATRAGAVLIRDEARRRAPKRVGNLRDEIKARRQKSITPGSVVFAVSWTVGKASRTPGFYGLFAEKGTTARVRKSGGSTGRQEDKPFLLPAYDSKKDAAASIISKELLVGIAAVAKAGGA